MNGNELLRPGGEKRGGLDASLAAEDLELTRLSQLLFPGLGAGEALEFAFGLLTDDGETIRLRQEILGDLLDHPALRETMEKLRGILEELETCSRGVRDNLTGMKVSRLDAAVDGLKKAVLKLEKNLSQQGADILEENAADNRYAQLLRFTHFRRRLTALYAEAIGLLRGSTRGEKFASASLRALGEWAEACYEKDRVAETEKALRDLDAEWKGVSAFAVDVCLDARRNVVGLEMAEVREMPYARPGMLEAAGSGEERSGVTSLLQFPQTGTGTLFQEYLLSEVGYEVRSKLTRLRESLTKLPVSGIEELLTLRDALRFYTGAAAFAEKLRSRGAPLCAPSLTEEVTFRFREAMLPEQSCTGALPVPNDLTLSKGGSILMTGPNSSGKTCCLIMAGQFLFLGQLGCLLPAKEASFSPRDRLLTLFAAGESETGEDSRMGLEVQRLGLLQEHMTDRSIFFFNEPMTSTSATEGGQICVDLLADLAGKGVPSLLVTHFNHIWPQLRERFDALGASDKLQSLVMTSEETEDGLRYLYKLKEAPPPPSSHARAVVAAKGVTLEAMVEALSRRGLDMRAGDPGWDKVRQGAV